MVNIQTSSKRLIKRARAYGAEVSTEKSKITTNNTNNISADISVDGKKLEELFGFQDLLATLCKSGTWSALGLSQQWQ